MKSFYKSVLFLYKHKAWIIIGMFSAAFSLGFGSYLFAYDLSLLQTFSYTINLFIDPVPSGFNGVGIEIASIIAKLTLFFAVIIFFLRSQLEYIYRYHVLAKGNHILIIGLDKSSRFLIENELKQGNDNIVIVEPNHHHDIKKYRNYPLCIINERIDNVVKHIGVDTAQYIFVSTGDDKENIYAALKITETAQENAKKKLLIHIENRTLRSLYNDSSLLDGSSIDNLTLKAVKKLDMRPFSYNKESARLLFQRHDIDGVGMDIIGSSSPFEIAVIGNSDLAVEVIAEAVKVAHLPNQNKLTIHCIDKDIESFKRRVEYEFAYIERLDYIKIHYIHMDAQSIAFCRSDLWHDERLKHIIFCFDHSMTNIQVATKLKRVAYKEQLDNRKRKIHVATYDNVELSKELRKYNSKRDDIFVFANANMVCKRSNLIHNPLDKLAKLIHYGYKFGHYSKLEIDTQKEIEAVCREHISVNDKRSSVAQALHINMKLKALGLKRKRTGKSVEDLVEINNEVFDAVLHEERERLGLQDDKLSAFDRENPHFFPRTYETAIERILRAEHNRWVAMLTMMDNLYDKRAKGMPSDKRKLKKIHHLLKPFNEFEKDEEGYIINDIYSLFYIPEYMASIGYEIVEY